MKKILLVDDHSLIRTGIKSSLESSGLSVGISEADSLNSAREEMADNIPDLVILDISLPDGSGMDFAVEIMNKYDLKVIMLSMYDDYDYVSRCLDIGVNGYVLKREGDEIIEAIRNLNENKDYYSSGVRDLIVKHYTDAKKIKTQGTVDAVNLTNREKEVLKYVTKGMKSHEIADKLFISTRTVDTHRSNIMRKLKVNNSIGLVNKANELNLL